jgi:hypothetical protein
MSATVYRAVSVGLLAGAATFLALGPSAGYGSQIWAVFIAWATFCHLGGGLAGLHRTITHNLFGVVVGVVALVFATQQPFGLAVSFPLWAAAGVALTIGMIVLASKAAPLSDAPASMLGYVAALVAALPDYRLERILSPGLENPAVGLVASLVMGALLAFVADGAAELLRQRFSRSEARSTASV